MIEIRRRETGRVLHVVEADTLEGANLSGGNLHRADLNNTDLSQVDLSRADLSGADLTNANLSRSVLYKADLNQADLSQADLSSAELIQTFFYNTNLDGADLSDSELLDTIFIDCSTLHNAKGLETIAHSGRSILDQHTLRACVNDLPDVFLLGVGYNKEEIRYLRAMYASGVMGGGIRYYSCFLSYAHSDVKFVEKLRTDLLNNGVNCWKDDELQTGTKWRDEIDKAIGGHEKLVLVCSQRSLYREQVVREILRALDDERKDGTQKFFPVCLDKSIFDDETMDDAREKVKSGEWRENWVYHVRKYQAADFSGWEKDGEYQKALTKLLHDLKNPEKR